MDIILCEARAYSIKFTAIRKIYDNAEKRKKQEELDDAVRLLEADDGADPQHSNKLIENMKTLSDEIQEQIDIDEQEAAKKFLAKRNLEAETPTKNFCNQVKKSKQKTKIACLLEKRAPTPQEFARDPTRPHFKPYQTKPHL